MALVSGRPFLEYILARLQKRGETKVVLSVGYKSKVISDYFQSRYGMTEIEYAVEGTPLGTGGGILQSLKLVNTNQVLVLNGDTFFQIDILKLFSVHNDKEADVTIAAKYQEDTAR